MVETLAQERIKKLEQEAKEVKSEASEEKSAALDRVRKVETLHAEAMAKE